MKLTPVKLAPNRVRRNYRGGRRLDELSGAPSPADGDRPEDWLLSATAAVNPGLPPLPDEGISRIPQDGVMIPLPELLRANPVGWLGAKHFARFGATPGFLLKLLDSSIRLHLQCHPSAAFSRRVLNVNAGKTEGYLILGHRPEVKPYIYLGFQRPPTPAAFRRAILEQDIDALLGGFDRIPVAAGEVFLVPGGIPHAIGEGVLMVEIMEPTDLAVRLEFEREGIVLPEPARFMNRDVDFALSMIDFSAYDRDELRRKFFAVGRVITENSGGRHVSCLDARQTDCFRLETVEATGRIALRHDVLRMLVVTAGSGRLEANGVAMPLVPGDRVLIPAAVPEVELAAAGKIAAAVALPPAC
jgi:mannose-6-phosphate isomerase